MSKRAEETALKAYPINMRQNLLDSGYVVDGNVTARRAYIKGYELAEEDIISIIESRIGEILGDAQPAPVLREELRDLIDKIKEK